jgi:hypothetical protein
VVGLFGMRARGSKGSSKQVSIRDQLKRDTTPASAYPRTFARPSPKIDLLDGEH